MNSFIINISKKQLYKFNLNALITIYDRKYQKIKTNSIVSLCKPKRTEHNFNSDSKYFYCWNCAYQTWNINKKPTKDCIPLVIVQLEVVKKVNKNERVKISLY